MSEANSKQQKSSKYLQINDNSSKSISKNQTNRSKNLSKKHLARESQNNIDSYSDDSNQDSGFVSRTILKTFDDHVNQDKEKLKQIKPMWQRKEEIDNMAKDLKVKIYNLEATIQAILDKHHRDYISTFSNFMDTVRKDLKLKLEQMERVAEEKQKINDVRLIRCERDYFRLESIRLSRVCKEMKSKIDDMAIRMKILGDEVNNVTMKWKDSEGVNKQLLLELQIKIETQKDIERELLDLREELGKKNIVRNLVFNKKQKPEGNIVVNDNNSEDEFKNQNKDADIVYNGYESSNADNEKIVIKNSNENNIENNENNNELLDNYFTNSTGIEEEERKIQELSLVLGDLKRTKAELKKEKEKNQTLVSELNNIYLERNKLENIFIDCVEEARKIVFQRRQKEHNAYKVKKKTGLGKYDYKMDMMTKYENFLPSDKQSIIENFLFNEEISNLIREAIFNKPQRDQKKFEESKNIINTIHLYEQDKRFKMKQLSSQRSLADETPLKKNTEERTQDNYEEIEDDLMKNNLNSKGIGTEDLIGKNEKNKTYLQFKKVMQDMENEKNLQEQFNYDHRFGIGFGNKNSTNYCLNFPNKIFKDTKSIDNFFKKGNTTANQFYSAGKMMMKPKNITDKHFGVSTGLSVPMKMT